MGELGTPPSRITGNALDRVLSGYGSGRLRSATAAGWRHETPTSASAFVRSPSDVWSLTRAHQRDYPDHFVLECLGKRNCQLGTAWNLKGSQEDFSWVLKSVVDPNDLLPEKRRELKARIVQLLTDAASGLTAQEIAAELGCNAEVARRSCRELALGQHVEKVKAESNGGRPPWLYWVGTFPTQGE